MGTCRVVGLRLRRSSTESPEWSGSCTSSTTALGTYSSASDTPSSAVWATRHWKSSSWLSAVHSRLHGLAAPLPCLPAGIPGAERAVDGRRLHPGCGLCLTHDLFRLVAALRKGRGSQSLERGRTGVDDRLASADPQLRRDPGGDLGSLRLRTSGGDHRWPQIGR